VCVCVCVGKDNWNVNEQSSESFGQSLNVVLLFSVQNPHGNFSHLNPEVIFLLFVMLTLPKR